MVEILSKRTYASKTYRNLDGSLTTDFGVAHLHAKDDQGNYVDIEDYFVDKGSCWELKKHNYLLRVEKDFGVPQLIRYSNKWEGNNHAVDYEPHSLWWVHKTNPSNRQPIAARQSVVGQLSADARTIIWRDAFGADIDFVLRLGGYGFRKAIRFVQKPSLNPPTQNHIPVLLQKYTGQGLKLRANNASQDWDENSYYESEEGFELRESDAKYKSFIRPAFIVDEGKRADPEAVPSDWIRRIKVFWERQDNELWQAKVLPLDFLKNATYPVLADTQTDYTPGSGDGVMWNLEKTWSVCRTTDPCDGCGYLPAGVQEFVRIQQRPGSLFRIWKGYLPFNTTGLLSGWTITAAEVRVYVDAVVYQDNDAYAYFGIVPATCANTDSLITDDWSEIMSSTIYGQRDLDTFGTGQYEAITLTDFSGIVKEGWTKFGTREGHDIDDVPLDSGSNTMNRLDMYESDYGGSNYQPILRVTYSNLIKKVINEALHISETKNRLKKMVRTVAETVNISEAKNRLKKMVRTVAETVNVAENIVKKLVSTGQDLVKVISETVNMGEGIVRARVMIRQLSETVNISEGINRLKKIVKAIAETVNISEAKNKVMGFVRVIDETLNISEGILKFKGVVKVINEALHISETVGRVRKLVRHVAEVVNIQETRLKARVMIRQLDEALQIQENVTRLKKMVRMVADVVNISEAKNKVMGFVRVINESLNIDETVVKIKGIVQVISDILNISENISRVRSLIRLIDENLDISEVSVRSRKLVRQVGEVVHLQEGVLKARKLLRLVNETLHISETLLKIRGIVRVVDETLNISETIRKIKGYVERLILGFVSKLSRVVLKKSTRTDTIAAKSAVTKTVKGVSKCARVLTYTSEWITEEEE